MEAASHRAAEATAHRATETTTHSASAHSTGTSHLLHITKVSESPCKCNHYILTQSVVQHILNIVLCIVDEWQEDNTLPEGELKPQA